MRSIRESDIGVDCPDVIYMRVGASLGLQLHLCKCQWDPLPLRAWQLGRSNTERGEKSRNCEYGDIGRRTNAGKPNNVREALGIVRRQDSLGEAQSQTQTFYPVVVARSRVEWLRYTKQGAACRSTPRKTRVTTGLATGERKNRSRVRS